MSSTCDPASDAHLPVRVQTYIEALVRTCAQDLAPLVSVVLFGSAAKGGFSGDVSDVDVIIVVADDASRAKRLRLGEDVASLLFLDSVGIHGLLQGGDTVAGAVDRHTGVARRRAATRHGSGSRDWSRCWFPSGGRRTFCRSA